MKGSNLGLDDRPCKNPVEDRYSNEQTTELPDIPVLPTKQREQLFPSLNETLPRGEFVLGAVQSQSDTLVQHDDPCGIFERRRPGEVAEPCGDGETEDAAELNGDRDER